MTLKKNVSILKCGEKFLYRVFFPLKKMLLKARKSMVCIVDVNSGKQHLFLNFFFHLLKSQNRPFHLPLGRCGMDRKLFRRCCFAFPQMDNNENSASFITTCRAHLPHSKALLSSIHTLGRIVCTTRVYTYFFPRKK